MSPKTPVGSMILHHLQDGQRYFVREIAAGIGAPHAYVGIVCKRLTTKGLLIREPIGLTFVYRISDKGLCCAQASPVRGGPARGSQAYRFRGSLRARAWRVMRMMPWFGVSDILMTIADNGDKGAEKNVARYVRALNAAGYLGTSRRDAARYHLERNTGPLAPALNTQTHTLTDANTGEVHNV